MRIRMEIELDVESGIQQLGFKGIAEAVYEALLVELYAENTLLKTIYSIKVNQEHFIESYCRSL